MSDNIKVIGSTETNAVNVATDDIDDVHYPIYKLAIGADGTAKLVGDGTASGGPVYVPAHDEIMTTLLNGILKEMRIMNIHLSMMTDNEISKAEID